ncbi:MAG TPA: hypothetical protein VK357_14820 [Rubrobacteraceae bacterium]|nr:hypothetical protein [Rubrobacteraceae bacterium]
MRPACFATNRSTTLPEFIAVGLALALLIAALLLPACAEGPGAQGPEEADNQGDEEADDARLDPDDPLGRDAETYAKDQDVSLEEAVRRLGLQEDVSFEELQPALVENEQDTFAGLWIQHRPEYRVVVLFTRDGEETIQPYIEGKRWADIVAVRNGASATLAEPKAEQAEAGRIVRDLGISFGGGIRQQENRVEIDVRNWRKFDAVLREADAWLPEHVVVFEVRSFPQPK